MNDIQVGDRVSWTQRTTARPYLHRLVGTVLEVWDGGNFLIHRDGDPTFLDYVYEHHELTKIEPRPIEALTDDYAQLMAMGDLGGAELS